MKKITGEWLTIGFDGTSRMYSKDTSLTSLPAEIRDCMKAPEGYVWCGFDYSNADLRCIADASGDKNLIDILNSGGDPHAQIWSFLTGVPVDQVTKEQRNKNKAIVFGILYSGGEPWSIATQLGVSREEAKELRDMFFDKFPTLKTFTEATVARSLKTYHVRTMMNRLRRLQGGFTGRDRKRMANQALNAVGQQSVGTVLKLALVNLNKKKKAGDPLFESIAQFFPVFDSIFFIVKESVVDALIEAAKPLVDIQLAHVKMLSKWRVGKSLGEVSR